MSPETDEEGSRGTRLFPCEGCLSQKATLRRCTSQTLCKGCRRKPAYRILTERQVEQLFGFEDPSVYRPLCEGHTPNCHDYRFAPQRVYFYKDMCELQKGLDNATT